MALVITAALMLTITSCIVFIRKNKKSEMANTESTNAGVNVSSTNMNDLLQDPRSTSHTFPTLTTSANDAYGLVVETIMTGNIAYGTNQEQDEVKMSRNVTYKVTNILSEDHVYTMNKA